MEILGEEDMCIRVLCLIQESGLIHIIEETGVDAEEKATQCS